MSFPIGVIVRRIALLAAALPASWLLRAAWGLPISLGGWPGAIRLASAASPHYRDGRFRNVLPTEVMAPGSMGMLLRGLFTHGSKGRPRQPVPLVHPEVPAQVGELALTWYGHASALLEIEGRRLLVDPVWSERVSPSRLIGPKRLHPVPVALTDLPALDAVLISHDHYDHLDLPTVRVLLRTQSAPFVVPLGVGAHLRHWGVPAARVIELDWDAQVTVAGVRLTCTEARHFSGRVLARDNTLWASWVIAGERRRVFFGGDTGYTPAFSRIGAEHGPFDLTLLPIGAYGDQWPDIHVTPEEAVRAHGDLGGDVLVPIHWASFDLAFHTWAEPADRLCSAAQHGGVRLCMPRPGQRMDITAPPPARDWWTSVA